MMNVFEKIREKFANIQRVVTCDEDLEWNRAVYECETLVNQVEKEHNNGWIVCSERLPKEDERVLCFHSHCFIDCGVLVGEVWCCDMDEYAIKRDNVIAWQPLQQPYKERDTNGN